MINQINNVSFTSDVHVCRIPKHIMKKHSNQILDAIVELQKNGRNDKVIIDSEDDENLFMQIIQTKYRQFSLVVENMLKKTMEEAAEKIKNKKLQMAGENISPVEREIINEKYEEDLQAAELAARNYGYDILKTYEKSVTAEVTS